VSRAHFLDLRGWLAAGDAKDVIAKILYQHQVFGHQRFLIQMTVGPTPHDAESARSNSSPKTLRPPCADKSPAARPKDNGPLLR
jgi:hypothetical protein